MVNSVPMKYPPRVSILGFPYTVLVEAFFINLGTEKASSLKNSLETFAGSPEVMDVFQQHVQSFVSDGERAEPLTARSGARQHQSLGKSAVSTDAKMSVLVEKKPCTKSPCGLELILMRLITMLHQLGEWMSRKWPLMSKLNVFGIPGVSTTATSDSSILTAAIFMHIRA